MTVGVMPLVALDGDAAAAQRAESITRDLTAMLARSGTLIRVIPVSTAQAKAARDDLGAAVRALNVRYLAEGEIRQGQDATIVGLRLVNGATGEQVWSESVSLKEADSPTDRSRALHAVVWHLYRSLNSAELRRVATQPPGEATPLDNVLRALALDKTEPDTLKRAREKEKLLDEALQRDPNLVPALTGLVVVLVDEIDVDVRVDRNRAVQRMDDLTSKAVRLNESRPAIWFFRSIALMFMGQWNASLEASAKAMRLEPDSSDLILHHASLMTLSGRPAEALALVSQAIAMDPQVNSMPFACEAQLMLGQYQQAITSCEKAKGVSGEDWTIDLSLAAAYGHLGDAGKAAAAKAAVLRAVPGYTIAIHKSKRYSVNPEYVRLTEEHLYAGLRKAGFAEK
jgi:TolB-like protein